MGERSAQCTRFGSMVKAAIAISLMVAVLAVLTAAAWMFRYQAIPLSVPIGSAEAKGAYVEFWDRWERRLCIGSALGNAHGMACDYREIDTLMGTIRTLQDIDDRWRFWSAGKYSGNPACGFLSDLRKPTGFLHPSESVIGEWFDNLKLYDSQMRKDAKAAGATDADVNTAIVEKYFRCTVAPAGK